MNLAHVAESDIMGGLFIWRKQVLAPIHLDIFLSKSFTSFYGSRALPLLFYCSFTLFQIPLILLTRPRHNQLFEMYFEVKYRSLYDDSKLSPRLYPFKKLSIGSQKNIT